MLQKVLGDNFKSAACVFKWVQWFAKGCEEVADDENPS